MLVEFSRTGWPMPISNNHTFVQEPKLQTPVIPSDSCLLGGILNSIYQPYALGLLSCIPFLLTYFFSCIESKSLVRSGYDGRNPPLLPYMIPVLGHALGFFRSPGDLIHKNKAYFGKQVPFRFRGMFQDMYLVSGPKNIALIFRRSKDFALRASVVIAMERLFGTPKRIVQFYDADDSGMEIVPKSFSNVRPQDRIHHIIHVQIIKYLSGNGLKPMAQRFASNMGRQIYSSGIGSEWLGIDDLYDFSRMKLLEASLDAMFGPYLTALNPTFVKDYWDFDEATALLLKGFPKWLVPRSWGIRQRCLDSLKKYNAYAKKQHDDQGHKDYEGLDPYFGTEFIRQRKEAMYKMDALDEDAIASEDLAIMWATNSNAIPASFWLSYEIFRDPVLLSRARAEVNECILPGSNPDAPQFDVSALLDCPLLQSCYAETLRLHNAVLITRMAEQNHFKLGDYFLPKDKLVLFASDIAHKDEDVWNAGTVDDPHSLNGFWADRFLIYPNDPASGPLKTPKINRAKQDTHDSSETAIEKPRFSMEGLSGAWIPYGGGLTLCPGRHYAKQEMILTFAILSTAFDLEILQKPGEKTKPDLMFYGLGMMPPKTKTPFRIRRRKRH